MALTFRVESRLPLQPTPYSNWRPVHVADPGDGVVFIATLSDGTFIQPMVQVSKDGRALDTMVKRPAGPIGGVRGPSLRPDGFISVHFYEDANKQPNFVACTEGALPPARTYLLEVRLQALQPESAPPDDKCECGAAKCGVGRGMAGHSSWCPWKSST